MTETIKTEQSFAKDPRIAAREFHAGVNQPNASLVVFFCSSKYDLNELADEINKLFPDTLVVGCTTAGEIGPGGYKDYSLSGVSFPADGFSVAADYINDLRHIDHIKGQTLANTLLLELEGLKPNANAKNTFACLLIDGLSLKEEHTVNIFHNALGEIPLFGGSAGDDLDFKETMVFANGKFHKNSAVLILVNTDYPFKIFKAQHFMSGKEKLVVTKANPALRIVNEINGRPAAEEYARVVGTQIDKLDAVQFSATPVVVRINGVDYVRSIQKVNPDGSLTFYCAIDNGLVFMAAQSIDIIKNLQQTFDEIKGEVGEPQVVLACDCILRNLQIQREGIKNKIEKILQDNNVVGFSTYGEQYMGVHINQTITGIAIGNKREKENV